MTRVTEGFGAATSRRGALVVGAVHAILFVVAGWLALTVAAEFAVGAFAAAPLFLPLAVVVVGTVRVSGGLVGGRVLLVAADLGIALLLGEHVVSTGERILRGSVVLFALAIGPGVLAAASTVLVTAPSRGRVRRSPRDR